MDTYEAKLVVTPDNTTPGSQGRLYLQLPEEMKDYVGKSFKVHGSFGLDSYVMFTISPVGSTVTPKRQFWWKNGVRDHRIRENQLVRVWLLTPDIWVAQAMGSTGETPPALPPVQDTLFDTYNASWLNQNHPYRGNGTEPCKLCGARESDQNHNGSLA